MRSNGWAHRAAPIAAIFQRREESGRGRSRAAPISPTAARQGSFSKRRGWRLLGEWYKGRQAALSLHKRSHSTLTVSPTVTKEEQVTESCSGRITCSKSGSCRESWEKGRPYSGIFCRLPRTVTAAAHIWYHVLLVPMVLIQETLKQVQTSMEMAETRGVLRAVSVGPQL